MEELTRSGRTIARVSNDQLLARASATLNNYVENLKIARNLGELYGFKVCAFWQPAIMDGHKPLVAYEQQYLDMASRPAYSFEPLYPSIRKQNGARNAMGSLSISETFSTLCHNPSTWIGCT